MQAFDIDPNYAGRAVESGSFQLWPWAPPAAARRTANVVREWRGRVPRERSAEYLAYMRRTGLDDYAGTPGHRGTWVLADREGRETEFVLLTFWDSREAIRAFAGDDIGRARYYAEDARYLASMPERLRHYDVLLQPGRW